MKTKLFSKDYYYAIPENDFIARKKYRIFVILSAVIFLTCISAFIETEMLNYPEQTFFLKVSLWFLGTCIAFNYFLLRWHKNTKWAYAFFIAISFSMLHIYAYFFGGVMSSTNYYLSVFAISTFMLLGRKAGWIYIGLASVHIIVITYLTTQTHFIYNFQGAGRGAMEEDMCFSVVIILILTGIHSSSNEKSEEVIHKEVEVYTGALEKSNMELDRFAYVVSHDLKAPLRAISSLSNWIEEDIQDALNDETKQNFDMLRSRVARMESLISGVLEYSKAGRHTKHEEEINMGHLIEDIKFMLDLPSNFNMVIRGEMPTLMLEKTKVEQVFSNIISNAIKYNDKANGKIIISCRDAHNCWEFSIADNGPGIAPEYRDKVFDIFATLQSKDTYESTGVGLAIVKKIIEEMGGHIHIESAAEEGADFIFTIPKKHDHSHTLYKNVA